MAAWIWFVALFVASWIPYFMAGLGLDWEHHTITEQDKAWVRALSVFDAVLTFGSFVWLFIWLGFWALLLIGLMVGVGFMLEAYNLNPYKAVKEL